MRRGAQHQEERGRGRIRVVAARHGNDAALVFHVVPELALDGVDPAVARLVGVVRARVTHAALRDEAFDHAVKRRSVVPAGLGQRQKIAHVIRRPVGLHFDADRAQRGLHRHRSMELAYRHVFEGILLLRLDRDLQDADRVFRDLVRPGRYARDRLDDAHSLGYAAKGGVLAVERRLRRDADEELRAVAIRLVRDADGGDDATLVLHVAVFGDHSVKAAGAPEVARGFGVLEERVATLDQAVGEEAEEGAAIVVALAREADELLDVLRGFVGCELEAEGAEVGGDDGFEVGGRGLLGEGRGAGEGEDGEIAKGPHRSLS